MTLKTALKAICETRYMIVMNNNGRYEFLRINYLGDNEEFCKARKRRDEFVRMKNKVNYITYNSAEQMLEIDCIAV